LILTLLFFSQIGYRFIYLIQQHELKEQAEAQLLSTINNDQFDQINEDDNRDNIIWEEEGKEFSLNGQLYDVAKKEVINGKTIFYCLNDKKEEQLIEEMSKKEKSNTCNSSNNKDGNPTVKFQLSDFVVYPQNMLFSTIQIIQTYGEYSTPLRSIIKEVNTPPPNNSLYSQTLIL
jgi:hypothetical protein